MYIPFLGPSSVKPLRGACTYRHKKGSVIATSQIEITLPELTHHKGSHKWRLVGLSFVEGRV